VAPGGQGEDVVSGTHDCLPLSALGAALPDAHDRLLDAGRLLERENGDVQDIEFTVERGRLYLLQSAPPNARRWPRCAPRWTRDEGAIGHHEALRRVSPEQLATVLAPRLSGDVADAAEVVARASRLPRRRLR